MYAIKEYEEAVKANDSPNSSKAKIKHKETDVSKKMKSPELEQDEKIAIRPVNEISEMTLMNATIQSNSTVRSHRTSYLVAHPQQDKDLLPVDRPNISVKGNLNVESKKSHDGYTVGRNILIR